MSIGASTHRSRRRIGVEDLLSLDRVLSGAVSHLVYWAGLAVIALLGFGVVGAAVGVALRNGVMEGLLLGLPLLVAGLLVVAALALVWRSVCEFFVAVLRIADDLHALRRRSDRGEAPPAGF